MPTPWGAWPPLDPLLLVPLAGLRWGPQCLGLPLRVLGQHRHKQDLLATNARRIAGYLDMVAISEKGPGSLQLPHQELGLVPKDGEDGLRFPPHFLCLFRSLVKPLAAASTRVALEESSTPPRPSVRW